MTTACLLDYAANRYSQAGEDGILAELIRRLPGIPRECVEFGAGDGETLSNTAALCEAGWDGVMIEADEDKFRACLERWAPAPRVTVHHARIGLCNMTNLDYYLNRWGESCRGVLSIDIDSNDWCVWDDLQLHRPWIVCVEFNPTWAPWESVKQDRDPDVWQGSSLLAMVQLAHAKGYRFVCATPLNAIFLAGEHWHLLGMDEPTPEAGWTYREAISTVSYGYDGSEFRRGPHRCPWQQTGGRYAGALKQEG